jgi:hypothetical protein
VKGVVEFSDGDEVPGVLFHTHIELIFQPTIEFPKHKDAISVNLIGVCELHIIPHFTLTEDPTIDFEGPDMPAVLIITYLSDIFDKTSTSTISVLGTRCELSVFKDRIGRIVQIMKQRLSFQGPDLRTIFRRDRSKSLCNRKNHLFHLTPPSSNILSNAEIDALRLSFPARHRPQSWRLLFSTQTDGVSHRSLLRLTRRCSPLVLLILNDRHEKVGAFLSDGLHDAPNFGGTGETFVFALRPLLEVFKWSGANEDFVAASAEEITIGGDGAALFLRDSLSWGASAASRTFASPPLAATPIFRLLDVEAWHVAPNSPPPCL